MGDDFGRLRDWEWGGGPLTVEEMDGSLPIQKLVAARPLAPPPPGEQIEAWVATKIHNGQRLYAYAAQDGDMVFQSQFGSAFLFDSKRDAQECLDWWDVGGSGEAVPVSIVLGKS